MINFSKYEEFVSQVTSEPSTNFVDFADRIGELDREGANIERLLTSGVGINAEVVNSLRSLRRWFSRQTLERRQQEHLIIELGDIMWYVAQATQSLGISMEEVLDTNIRKLSKRYPKEPLTLTSQKTMQLTTDEIY